MKTRAKSSPTLGGIRAQDQGFFRSCRIGFSVRLALIPILLLFAFLAAMASGCVTTSEGSAAGKDKGELLPVRCLEEPEPDPEPGRRVGYFYDYRVNRCKSFRYSRPDARVPFQTRADCVDLCEADR